MNDNDLNIEELIQKAREGDSRAMGDLLENYRNYLMFLARLQIDPRICGKLDAADLVQDTCLEAYQAFSRFRGENEASLLAWLRQILATRLATAVRYYIGTRQRDVRLERNLHAHVDQSSVFWNQLVSSGSTPSIKVSRKEMEAKLTAAMVRLPDHYREVLRLRHIEELSFAGIAERMERSVDSVQKLWVRALAKLREMIDE
ncbi:MAG: sigma-70 family RNA polymerase sigma factor [Planctomycetia bacterium]|nr:sigma-70 family RNA polymerase sigma factor [Planctomycetia bacterium]